MATKTFHKNLRSSRIAVGTAAFEVDDNGLLTPDPTDAQWAAFQGAQTYFFREHDDGAVEAPEPSPPPEPVVHPSRLPAAEDEDEDEDDFDFGDDDDADEDDGFAGDADDFIDESSSDEEAIHEYAGLKVEELRDLCKERGIPCSRLTKTELISALVANDLKV